MEEKEKKKKLLGDFAAPSYDQWLESVKEQLKGAPFEKVLMTKTPEEILLKPIYRKEDVSGRPAFPGFYPYTRGMSAAGIAATGWEISQQYYYPDPEEFNQAVRHDLSRGLSTVSILLDRAGQSGLDPDETEEPLAGDGGLSLSSGKDAEKAFREIDFKTTSFFIQPGISTTAAVALLSTQMKAAGISFNELKGALINDTAACLAREGSLRKEADALYNETAANAKWALKNCPSFRTIGINAIPYCESGGSAVHELAFAMASAVETTREMLKRGLDIQQIADQISFFFAINGDFFMNIAKIRSARVLWAKILKAFGGDSDAGTTRVHGFTARFNKTLHDPHVNILRATTEAFSGILAGCDSLSIAPFDEVIGLPDELSRRISRNIQMILKEEAHGHKVIDPAGGSWFVETLTRQLSESAWKKLQEVEKQGGILEALKSETVQKDILRVFAEREEKTALRKDVIVGTNMYPNLEEKKTTATVPDLKEIHRSRVQMADAVKSGRESVPDLSSLSSLQTDVSEALMEQVIDAVLKGATLGEINKALGFKQEATLSCNPLIMQRKARQYEELRAKAEAFKQQTGDWPKVFLANMGPLKQYKARADFSVGFLQPGGFSPIYSEGFDSVSDAVDATITSGAGISVICSTDDTYPDIVPEYVKMLKTEKPDITVVLAGYPKEHVESFKNAGVDEFIHLKANNLQLLKKFQEIAGV